MAGPLQQDQGQQTQGPPQQPQGRPQPPQGQPQGQPQQPQGQPQGQQPPGQVDAPPEQAKEQMDALLEASLTYLYGEGLKPSIQVMRNAQSPQAGMAKVIGTMMLTAFNTLLGQGVKLAPNVLMAAGINISKAVGEVARESGILNGDDTEAIESAFMDGVARFGRLVDKQALGTEQRQRYAEMIRGLRDMKEAGKQQTSQGQPQGQPQAKPQGQPQQPTKGPKQPRQMRQGAL